MALSYTVVFIKNADIASDTLHVMNFRPNEAWKRRRVSKQHGQGAKAMGVQHEEDQGV